LDWGLGGLLRFEVVLGIEFVVGFIVSVRSGVGVGWVEVVVVGGDGGGDGVAPGVGAEGVDVFVLGETSGLEEGLEHIGYGAGYAGFGFAADYCGD
jgi:hypothetical protein